MLTCPDNKKTGDYMEILKSFCRTTVDEDLSSLKNESVPEEVLLQVDSILKDSVGQETNLVQHFLMSRCDYGWQPLLQSKTR